MRFVSLPFLTLALAMIPHTAEAEAAPAPTAEAKSTKSIVPSKYGSKYRNGGSDALAEFIKTACTGKDGFEYTAFFALCRKNGIAEEQVAKYEGQVAAKQHGAPGRARMTLRNMLATVARKNGKLVNLSGDEIAIALPKAAAPAAEGGTSASPASDADKTKTEDADTSGADV